MSVRMSARVSRAGARVKGAHARSGPATRPNLSPLTAVGSRPSPRRRARSRRRRFGGPLALSLSWPRSLSLFLLLQRGQPGHREEELPTIEGAQHQAGHPFDFHTGQHNEQDGRVGEFFDRRFPVGHTRLLRDLSRSSGRSEIERARPPAAPAERHAQRRTPTPPPTSNFRSHTVDKFRRPHDPPEPPALVSRVGDQSCRTRGDL